MEEKTNIPWNEIGAYLQDGEASEYSSVVREWLNESPENHRIFQEIMDGWQLSRRQTPFYKPDMNSLWNQLMIRTGNKSVKRFSLNPMLRWGIAAAIVLGVFVTGIWLGDSYNEENIPSTYANVIVPLGSRAHIVLPDSSKVWLNSGAEIRYPAAFDEKSRDVFVRGECYFEVTKNASRQFIVHGKNLKVKVFGTSFNVQENADSESAEVTLLEGKVQVLNRAGSPITMLAPGEQFVLQGDRGMVKRLSNTSSVVSWKDNLLQFEDQPVDEVLDCLGRWYGVDFHVDSEILNNHRYTFNVKTESLREVLELISVITPIEYSIDGEEVHIKYK